MADWPSGCSGSLVSATNPESGQSYGKLVTSPASANTKGSWAELIASSGFDADGFMLRAAGGSAHMNTLLDIGIGAAGSEVVILPDVFANPGTGASTGLQMLVPIPIKAGTRLAARMQSTSASQNYAVMLHLFAGGFFSSLRLGRATTYGAATADSGGVSVDPGTTANTKGAWSEITSATTNPISLLALCTGNQLNTTLTSGHHLIDIGVGAAGSEQVVVPNLHVVNDTVTDKFLPEWNLVPASIKAGARLAVRAQSSVTNVDRLLDVTIIGFD